MCAKITGLGSNACVENECCLQGEFCIKAIYKKKVLQKQFNLINERNSCVTN